MTTHPLPEFKPEDFDDAFQQMPWGRREAFANMVNAKLRAWRDGLPKVHSNEGCPDKFWGSTLEIKDTHTARIFDIEEIKPKECEHKEISLLFNQPEIEYYCANPDCGKRLKPNWTAVE